MSAYAYWRWDVFTKGCLCCLQFKNNNKKMQGYSYCFLKTWLHCQGYIEFAVTLTLNSKYSKADVATKG